MNVPFRPILSALLRNRAGAVLVALQVAITLAVLVNAVYIVKQRVELINRPTGIDVDNIFVVSVTGFTKQFNYSAMLDEDISWLSSMPGVVGVTATNSVPLSRGGSSDIAKPTPEAKPSRSASRSLQAAGSGTTKSRRRSRRSLRPIPARSSPRRTSQTRRSPTGPSGKCSTERRTSR